MSNYAIMRFQKYKIGSVANIERHQKYRERLHNRAHPEREKENISYSQYNETMTRTLKRAVKEQEKTTGKKVRKGATQGTVLCVFVGRGLALVKKIHIKNGRSKPLPYNSLLDGDYSPSFLLRYIASQCDIFATQKRYIYLAVNTI